MLDRERTLRITWRSLETLEEQHGLTLHELSEQLGQQQMKAIRHIVWLGLLHEDPGLTLDATADLLDQADLVEVATAAVKLLAGRFGGNGKAAAPKKRKGTAAKAKL
jgi:urease accessory protein UreF